MAASPDPSPSSSSAASLVRAPLARLHALPPPAAPAAAAAPLPPQSARDFVPASDARFRQHRCFPRLRDAAMIAGHALPGGDLAIVTPSGLSIIGPRGVVKGQDALGAEQTLLAAGWASEARLGPVVALLSTPEPGADFTRLAIVSARDGRLVASHRVRLAADPSMIVAVEGRLIIHAGTGCAVIPLE